MVIPILLYNVGGRMKTKKIVLSGVLIAVGILLPIIFHSFNMGGQIFLPMHIPVLIAGMLVGPLYGTLVGIITPVLSSVLTGMPSMFPMLPIMVFELATYGFVSGYIYNYIKKNTYLSLIAGMIDGRIVAGIVVFILARFFGAQMSVINFVKMGIVTGLPGILIQLIIIPPLVKLLKRSLDK